jgi:hypothetical protein
MQPLDFLAAVLPSSGNYYCVAEFTTPKKEHVFVTDIADIPAIADRMSKQKSNAYFGLATYKTNENRYASNAMYMKSLFMDIDLVSKGVTCYASQDIALQAFNEFMQKTGMADLGQPYILSSGGGWHIYWPFDEDVSIDQWKPVAENFKRLCAQEKLVIDNNCTADAARVLRVPGTYNYKKDTPRLVEVHTVASKAFTLFEIDQFIKSKLVVPTYETTTVNLPGKRPKAVENSTVKKLIENSSTLFKNILERTQQGTGCAQLEHYIENAENDGMEPIWRGWLSIAQKCDDGGKAAIWLSKLHPYEPERMTQKLREIKGPYPCLKFDSENPGICTNCPHFSKITNPLALGRQIITETAAKEIALELTDDATPTQAQKTIHRPAAPRGFSYGKNGAVFRDTKVEDADGNETNKQVMILPYSLFVVNILQHKGEHIVHMLATRPEGAFEITLNQRAVVSKDETLKNLAEQNILAAGGWNDKNLFEYVRSCVEEASVAQRAIKVPDNYGWQKDDTFVYAESIFSAGQQPRHVPMRHLVNINKVCTPSGSLDNWRKVVTALTNKQLYEVLSLSLVGFGTPLMRFTGYDGITFHLGSTESGTGKTLTLELASSVWGHPTQYRVNKSTSDVAMQQRLGLLHSLPLISDEITSKNRKDFEWMPGFIFDVSEGQGKERMESGANKERENNTYWKSMALLSSNTHVMDYLTGARKHSSEGEIRRVLELTLNNVISWEPDELESVELIKQNYGVAGPIYVQYLVDNLEEVKELVRNVHKKVKAEFKFKDDERYWHAGCTALVAGAMLAAKAGLVEYPIKNIIAVLKDMVDSARKLVKDNVRTAEDVLNSYVREFYGKFVVVKALDGALAASIGENGVIDQSITRSEIAGRVEHGVTPGHVDFYIEEQLLKKYCSSMSFGYADFRKQMELMYHISYSKKDLMSKTKGPQMRVNAMRISRKVEEDPVPLDKAA